MQMLVDFLPIIVFFVVYFTFGIYPATAAIIAVMVIQIAVTWLIKRTVSKMLLVSGSLAVVLGGITLVLREPLFIQLKLTVVDGLFAIAFLGSQFIGEKTLTERIMGHVIDAPATLWRQLNRTSRSWRLPMFTSSITTTWIRGRFSRRSEHWVLPS